MANQIPERNGAAGLAGCTILVTGASGFIGTRVVQKLVTEHQADVIALVRNRSDIERMENTGASVVNANLSDREAVFSALQGVELVIHLAYDIRRSQKYICTRPDTPIPQMCTGIFHNVPTTH